jgi:hypothetical protein
MNDRSFEDHEKTLEGIKSLLFNTLYLWTTAFVSSLVISFYDFIILFAPISNWLLLYTPRVPKVPYAFNDISITY